MEKADQIIPGCTRAVFLQPLGCRERIGHIRLPHGQIDVPEANVCDLNVLDRVAQTQRKAIEASLPFRKAQDEPPGRVGLRLHRHDGPALKDQLAAHRAYRLKAPDEEGFVPLHDHMIGKISCRSHFKKPPALFLIKIAQKRGNVKQFSHSKARLQAA